MSDLRRFRMLINGSLREAADYFPSINPASGEPWALIPRAGVSETEEAIAAARKAFTGGEWSGIKPSERGRALRRLGQLLSENAEELGRIETIDTGKLFKETRFQANYIAEYYEYFAGLADKVEGRTLPLDKHGLMAFTVREPLGVVAAIVPWNSQLMLSSVKLGPALAAGNTVVVKASEHASAAILEFGEIVAAAGFPPGVINIVSGFADPVGRLLTSHPDVDRISFTGGVESARSVVANSAQSLAQVSLELGGKSPIVIFDDADLESALNGVLAGIFGASGQSCVAGSRLCLQESIARPFLEELAARAKRVVVGDPLDPLTQMGPLATVGQLTRIEDAIKRAAQEGAKMWAGGKRPDGAGAGFYFEPTILEFPSHTSSLLDEEFFGPVLSVLRFKDEDEAIEMANATRFGLASGLFTADIGRAMRMSKAFRSGIVWVNTYRVIAPSAEFGGFKDSGYGREGGFQSIYDYTQTKTVWINTSPEPIADPFVLR